jgi:hypothetical protein
VNAPEALKASGEEALYPVPVTPICVNPPMENRGKY